MRKVVFEGSTLETLRQLPVAVRLRSGYEIDRIQRDMQPENWKPFSSVGKGVREVRIQVGQQYRIMYIAKFEKRVHILHIFEKKSQKTRRTDIEIAKSRLKAVIERYQQ